MSRIARAAAGGLVVLAATVALGWLSQVPYGAAGEGEALVRLAWRTPGTRVEECRGLTPEELQQLPVHMRQEQVCEGRMLPYRLAVRLDGRPVANEVVHATGARADRPLYVYREFPVSQGGHDIQVTFSRDLVPADTASTSPSGERREPPAPPRLEFQGRVVLARDEIALVTYDPEQRRLVLKGYGAP